MNLNKTKKNIAEILYLSLILSSIPANVSYAAAKPNQNVLSTAVEKNMYEVTKKSNLLDKPSLFSKKIANNEEKPSTPANINNNSGIFKYIALHDTTPPNNSDPVSPIKTFALFKLKIKKPKHVPHTMLPNIITSFTSSIIAITVIAVTIANVTDVANPSTPSVKLIAFVVANITNIVNGI